MSNFKDNNPSLFGRPPTGSLANRPGSRSGLGSSWGRGPGAGGAAVPGGTGIARPAPTNYGLPPGTAAMRMGTASGARPGSAARGAGGYVPFQIVDRPMTQQGLGGIKVGLQGPGRMIQDATFFMGELRQRINRITAEIGRLMAEYDAHERESASFLAFEKKAESLAAELREMQKKLGDYNTLIDKLHTDADLEDLERACASLKAKNQMESKAVDEIFTARQQKESMIRETEKAIEDERRKAEERLNEMDPSKRTEFFDLKDENNRYQNEISQRQPELDELEKRVKALEEELSMDMNKKAAIDMQKRLEELRQRKAELEAAGVEPADGEGERERLLQKVREDNQEIAGMERKAIQYEDDCRKLRDQLQQLDADLEEAQGEKNAKYEELVRRDKEMQSFLDSFEQNKKIQLDKLADTEANIAALLTHISRNMLRQNHLPNAEGFKQIQNDLNFKEKEMENAQLTVEAMTAEKQRRAQDLEKVNQLEAKLNAELTHLTDRITKMNAEMAKFGNVQQFKSDAEAKKKKLNNDRNSLLSRRDQLKSSVQFLTQKHDAKRAQLSENETYNQLGALEQKMRMVESTNHQLNDFIQTKSKEADYKTVRADVLTLVEECNAQLIKLSQKQGAR